MTCAQEPIRNAKEVGMGPIKNMDIMKLMRQIKSIMSFNSILLDNH